MEKKDFMMWTVEEFRSLPRPDSFWNNIGEVDSLVVVPCDYQHDSGFRCMEFVAIQHGEPTYLLGGSSDVIDFGGIGGYNIHGDNIPKYIGRLKSQTAPVSGWRIDCLPVSGLLRIMNDKKIIVGASISDFEIYFKED